MVATQKHFDAKAFLDAQAKPETLDFWGVEVPKPTDLPLNYTLKIQEIQDKSIEDKSTVLDVLRELLGAELVDEIESANPGIRGLGALFVWCVANASGENMDFPTAFEKYVENEAEEKEKAKADAEGKARRVPANRGERRAVARNGKRSAKTFG